MTAYVKSKVLAERAAWDFTDNHGGRTEPTVVNPVGIFGPVLSHAEPAWDSRPGRCGFDQTDVAALYQFGTPASSSQRARC